MGNTSVDCFVGPSPSSSEFMSIFKCALPALPTDLLLLIKEYRGHWQAEKKCQIRDNQCAYNRNCATDGFTYHDLCFSSSRIYVATENWITAFDVHGKRVKDSPQLAIYNNISFYNDKVWIVSQDKVQTLDPNLENLAIYWRSEWIRTVLTFSYPFVLCSLPNEKRRLINIESKTYTDLPRWGKSVGVASLYTTVGNKLFFWNKSNELYEEANPKESLPEEQILALSGHPTQDRLAVLYSNQIVIVNSKGRMNSAIYLEEKKYWTGLKWSGDNLLVYYVNWHDIHIYVYMYS
jgi:hypothetical protein